MKDLTEKQMKEMHKFSQIIDISKAIAKHIEIFDGETEQIQGALSLALNNALKKAKVSDARNAVVDVRFF